MVKRLEKDPNDVEVREDLATILAMELGKIEMAVEQLELLAAMPEQPEAKCAELLARMAVWELELGGDVSRAQKHLLRLIQEYPRSKEAFEAQRRLSTLNLEARMARARGKGGRALASGSAS